MVKLNLVEVLIVVKIQWENYQIFNNWISGRNGRPGSDGFPGLNGLKGEKGGMGLGGIPGENFTITVIVEEVFSTPTQDIFMQHVFF